MGVSDSRGYLIGVLIIRGILPETLDPISPKPKTLNPKLFGVDFRDPPMFVNPSNTHRFMLCDKGFSESRRGCRALGFRVQHSRSSSLMVKLYLRL